MPRTTPAPSSTRRCLVMAWRVRGEPSASLEIDWGGPLASLPTSDSRVPSPSAAKSEARSSGVARRSARALDMALDVRHLLGPAPLVHAEGLDPALRGQGVEPGLPEE